MTVQNVLPCVEYTANGVQTNFAFIFRVDDPTWIVLGFPDNFLALNLNADQDSAPGGSVDYSIAPPDQQIVLITRVTPKDQDLDYTRYDPFDSESHEDALDKLTMLVQDLCKIVVDGLAFLQDQIDLLVNSVFTNFCLLNQVVVSAGGVVNFDFQLGMGISITLTEDITTVNFLNIPAGTDLCQFELDLIQDSTPRVVTWPASILWPASGTIPDITAADSRAQIHLRTTDAGVTWLGSYVENIG